MAGLSLDMEQQIAAKAREAGAGIKPGVERERNPRIDKPE
jgi:hypothetical protein